MQKADNRKWDVDSPPRAGPKPAFEAWNRVEHCSCYTLREFSKRAAHACNRAVGLSQRGNLGDGELARFVGSIELGPVKA